ncbi:MULTISPECIES: SPRY domain-containing protein, partial [unclassified Lysinibacillus]|uniref:SPRY domain-containing protein n=1 Tax=unclassified Lysinibacillus TaxID=2636778 RepID=UPI003809700A
MVVTLDPINKGNNVTLKNDNMTAVIVDAFGTARASLGRSSGKWYYEITFEQLTNAMVNVITNESVGTTYNLITSRGYYSLTGTKWNGAQSISLPYGTVFKAGDTVGVNLNLDGGVLTFYVNDVNQGVAFTDLKTLGALFPAITSGSSTGGCTATFNFGATPFKYHPTDIKYKTLSYDGSRVINPTNKTFILHDGEYKKWNKRELNNESIVPIMTSNTSPNGVASASSIYNANYDAYVAFDGSDSLGWCTPSSIVKGWLKYKFDSKKIVAKYTIRSTGNVPNIPLNAHPQNWTFEGSNNDSDWIILDTQTNISFTSAIQEKEFSIANNEEYLYYRLNITKNNGSSSYLGFGELKMFSPKSPDKPNIWSIVSTTLPNPSQFLDKGMNNLSPLFDRRIETLEPTQMTLRNDILVSGEIGKVFSKTINLNKYFDIRS